MPYQGSEYQVPSQYGRAFPYGQPMQQPGQAQGHALPPQQRGGQAAYSSQQFATNGAQLPGRVYDASISHSQTAYSTPQYYNQTSPSSYHQTPQRDLQHPQYLSPPSQRAHLPPQLQYSPDPLQYYQAPPQPRGPAPFHSPSRQPQQQYRQPQVQTTRLQQSVKSSQSAPWTSRQEPSRAPNAGAVNTKAQALQQPALKQRAQQQRDASNLKQSTKGQRQIPSQSTVPRPAAQSWSVSSSSQAQAASSREPSQHALIQRGQHTPSSQQAHQPLTPQSTNIVPGGHLRTVAQVEVPVQRQTIKIEQSETMARSLKRRRSDDGRALPACQPTPAMQSYSVKTERPDQKPSSSSPPAAHPSQISVSAQSPSIDYQTVLLSLSDEYINAAYSMTKDLQTAEVAEEQLDQYQSLLATGMGCLDAVLKRYRLSDPRKEARVRLRYATLLHEETENDENAEDVLSKGVSICQRARLLDPLYAMHYLLARIWFKAGKIKAAMKAIDKLIVEVEKLSMVHWIYAFRFLRVSLPLQNPLTNSETLSLIRNLTAVNEVANGHNHVSVAIVASTIEALIHLRSCTPESVDQAQRAIAKARMHQLSGEMASMSQVKLLLDCVDLGCALSQPTQAQAASRMQAMQKNMDECTRDASWTADGTFLMPLCDLGKSAVELERDTCSIFKRYKLGETVCALPLKWLTEHQVYALGFLLTGLSNMHGNSQDKRAEKFLSEGLNIGKLPEEHPRQSLRAASDRYDLNRRMRIWLRLYVVFAFTGRAEWQSAFKGVGNIREDLKQLGSKPGAYIDSLLNFLEGSCKHGLGDLDGALRLYQSPQLKIEGTLDPRASTVNPISVVAALNSVPILRLKGGGREPEVLLNQIAEYCLTHKNGNGNEYGSKTMEAALYILKSGEPNDPGATNTIIKTKGYLQNAIAAAKTVTNNRLLTVVMAMMTAMFFARVVGEQAEKSSRAGRSLARKSQDKLWMAVSDNMFCSTLEKSGKISEAEGVRQEAQSAMASLPKSLQGALMAHAQVDM